MEEWKRLALLLCIYGVLKEMRPLEPFITRFLSTPPMNFTHDEINMDIYPVSVYSNLVSLVIIFLVTDWLRYKPVIILNCITGITLYMMLLVFRSVFAMQIVQVFYGLYTACEVAYYTYIYAKVDKSHFQEVTGYTRAAYLTGRAVSGVISQVLLALGLQLMTFAEITLGILVVSLGWAAFLPPVSNSIYFNRATPAGISDHVSPNRIEKGFKLLRQHFLDAFSQTGILKFFFWWGACNGGYLQVLQFIQVLWEEIIAADPQGDLMLNGAVEAICTFSGALGAFSFGKWKVNWEKHGELALFLGSCGLGSLLILMSQSRSMIIAYITYILYSVVYNAIVTVAKSQIASNIRSDSIGLIFGFTIFLALVLQTIITIIFVQYLGFTAKFQFLLYGGYHIIIGAAFGIKWIYTTLSRTDIQESSSVDPQMDSTVCNERLQC